MPHVEGLRRKIELILPRAGHLLGKDGRRATQGALAAHLGISPGTLSEMINGRNREPIVPEGMVPPHHLDSLVRLLCDVIGSDCSSSDAERLWVGSPETFEAALGGRLTSDLFETLAQSDLRLTITTDRRPRQEHRAVENVERLPADAISLGGDEELQFRIDASPDRQLIVLCLEPLHAWRVIAPGPLHDGSIRMCPTLLPAGDRRWLTFRAPLGLHRFVFIEYAEQLEPLLPPLIAIDALLDRAAISALSQKLRDSAPDGTWRSAEKVVNVMG